MTLIWMRAGRKRESKKSIPRLYTFGPLDFFCPGFPLLFEVVLGFCYGARGVIGDCEIQQLSIIWTMAGRIWTYGDSDDT